MPNTTSAKKALRQNAKKRLQNRSQRSALRTAIKKARVAVAAGGEDVTETLRLATKKIDQAAAKNLIHKNTAARTKSRLARLAKPKQPATT